MSASNLITYSSNTHPEMMWTGDTEGASWKLELVMVGITGLEGEYAHSVESVSLILNDSYGSVYVLLATTSNQVNSSALLS